MEGKSHHPAFFIRLSFFGLVWSVEWQQNSRHLILLPRIHVTPTIIVDLHERNPHMGPRLLLHSFRSQYWPIRGWKTVTKSLHKFIRYFALSFGFWSMLWLISRTQPISLDLKTIWRSSSTFHEREASMSTSVFASFARLSLSNGILFLLNFCVTVASGKRQNHKHNFFTGLLDT